MSARLPLADIQFIAEFAAFARSKGDERYDYESNKECACAQFLLASGRASQPCVGVGDWYDFADTGLGWGKYPSEIDGVLESDEPTFSALADRLEALIADAPAVEPVR